MRGGAEGGAGRGGAGAGWAGPGRAGAGQTRVPYAQHLWALRAHPWTPAQGQEGSDREPGLSSSPEGLSLSCQLPSMSQIHCSSRRHHGPQEPQPFGVSEPLPGRPPPGRSPLPAAVTWRRGF